MLSPSEFNKEFWQGVREDELEFTGLELTIE